MSDGLRSFLMGTAGLDVAVVVAAVLTIKRRPASLAEVTAARVAPWFVAGIAVQFAHFSEEFITGFHLQFPVLLGLAPWPTRLFVNFNLAWVAVGLFSAPLLRRNFRPAFFIAWLFTLTAIANGIAHPLLALGTAGYFPGLGTSPLLGLIGLVLGRQLWRVTLPTA